MSQVSYDLLEMMRISAEKDQANIGAQTSAMEMRKRDAENEMSSLEKLASETLSAFLPEIQANEELNNAEKAFIQKQAKALYTQVVNQLANYSKIINSLFDSMDFSREDELLAEEPFKVTVNGISEALIRSNFLTVILTDELAALLAWDNTERVSTLEKYAIKLTQQLEGLKVFRSISQNGVAELHFDVTSIREWFGRFHFKHIFIRESDPKSREVFAKFIDNDHYTQVVKSERSDDDCLILFENYPIDRFMNDLCEMLMCVVKNLEATVQNDSSNCHKSWTISLRVKK